MTGSEGLTFGRVVAAEPAAADGGAGLRERLHVRLMASKNLSVRPRLTLFMMDVDHWGKASLELDEAERCSVGRGARKREGKPSSPRQHLSESTRLYVVLGFAALLREAIQTASIGPPYLALVTGYRMSPPDKYTM